MNACLDNNTLELVARQLENEGYIILPAFLPDNLTEQLWRRLTQADAKEFTPAGIGRGAEKQRCESVRRDRIKWLDESHETDNLFLSWMEQLRLGLNRYLYLGLFDYECHYAVYQPGTYYRKHLDALKGARNRVVSTVFYLNKQWQLADGGELVLYPEQGEGVLQTVSPEFSATVLFLSERFPHEVLAANRVRYSIAGWFRVQGSYHNIP